LGAINQGKRVIFRRIFYLDHLSDQEFVLETASGAQAGWLTLAITFDSVVADSSGRVPIPPIEIQPSTSPGSPPVPEAADARLETGLYRIVNSRTQNHAALMDGDEHSPVVTIIPRLDDKRDDADQVIYFLRYIYNT